MDIPEKPVRVIIVGGGVAGLTLANLLEQSDLDYLLLETHAHIAPPVGAGISLMPNGLLILDQIGVYEKIRSVAKDGYVSKWHVRSSDGTPMTTTKDLSCQLEERHGYPMLFFDRQWLLQILYDNLNQKDKVLVNSRVKQIHSLRNGVKVITHSGYCYTGDIVVGADGVHSVIRHEMHRLADMMSSGYFQPTTEDRVPCYYQCSFGIAQNVDGWPNGQQDFTTGRGKSFLVASGPGGRCYWFLFVKLPATLFGRQIPKYSSADEERFVQKHKDLMITETLTFGQLYAKRIASTLTPIHEIVHDKWFWGRILLIGDSAHKLNPIGGMGGNAAIETAAEFMNVILDSKAKSIDDPDGLTTDQITAIFKRVQDARHKRVASALSSSHQMLSLLAYERPLLSTFLWRVYAPMTGDEVSVGTLTSRVVGGTRLRHISLPRRFRTIPFHHELPTRPLRSHSRWFMCSILSVGLLVFHFSPSFRDSTTSAILGHDWLGNAAPKAYQLYCLAQLMTPLMIYQIEGYRIGNRGTLLALPSIFIISMQYLGVFTITTLYSILSVIQSRAGPAYRHVPKSTVEVFLLTLCLGYIAPVACSLTLGPTSSGWVQCIYIWQFSPAWFSALLAVLSFSNETRTQRIARQNSSTKPPSKHINDRHSDDDLPGLKLLYDVVFKIQAAVHIITLGYLALTSDLSPITIAMTALYTSEADSISDTLIGAISVLFRKPMLLAFAAFVYHGLLSIWSLRSQGLISTSCALRAGYGFICGQILVGPGASLAGLWRWREGILAKAIVGDQS